MTNGPEDARPTGAGADPNAVRHQGHTSRPLVVHIGREELVIAQRYAVASIANDVLIAVWFIIGSLLFFGPDTVTAGTWCFLAGSVELLIRPLLRLSRQLHLQRLRGGRPGPADSAQDF
ncbi:YrhK family protein [Streptomyces sp. XM4193]|uniref:YrhK family protein n=1 Tax=Streptomyces sp. XM4193 TaxID=2929782 RepID=UPI001FFA36FD|nr:YrhK family protein [Streptomyces sp. XM4193]MCK1794857.1 YrhK family protein [Streptomyces sp. XM4193]